MIRLAAFRLACKGQQALAARAIPETRFGSGAAGRFHPNLRVLQREAST